MTRIAGFVAELTSIAVGGDAIALWRVADLEQHVDRAALLAGDDPPEPPYWAHLWTGALVLAAAVPPDGGRALEIGCGLGLPGLVAARRGARVTFVDRLTAPLEFVRASAAANRLAPVDVCVADFASAALRGPFDLILAAEVLYDRATLGTLPETLRRCLRPGGRALLTDARRTDTTAFYAALDASRLAWHVAEHAVREEGLPLTVRLVEVRG
jgi:2-polyprenyl-3-methyl-5-hydroxy-6-metoxy-1,4-benzoquinol methylase